MAGKGPDMRYPETVLELLGSNTCTTSHRLEFILFILSLVYVKGKMKGKKKVGSLDYQENE